MWLPLIDQPDNWCCLESMTNCCNQLMCCLHTLMELQKLQQDKVDGIEADLALLREHYMGVGQ